MLLASALMGVILGSGCGPHPMGWVFFRRGVVGSLQPRRPVDEGTAQSYS